MSKTFNALAFLLVSGCAACLANLTDQPQDKPADIDTRWPVPIKPVKAQPAPAPVTVDKDKIIDGLRAELAKAQAQVTDATKRASDAEQKVASAATALSKSADDVARLTTALAEAQSRGSLNLPGSPVAYGPESYLPMTDRAAGIYRLDAPAPGQVIPDKNDVVSVVFKTNGVASGPTMPSPSPNQTVGFLVFLNDSHVVIAQSHAMVGGVPCWTNMVSVPLGSVDNVYVLNRARNVMFPPAPVSPTADPRFPR